MCVEELIESMDQNEIDKSVICGFSWNEESLCKEGNDYIVESLTRFPKRLLGLISICPKNSDDAASEIERCMQKGVIGVGEIRLPQKSLDTTIATLWTPIANFLVRNGLLCLLHSSEPIGHLYPGKGNTTPKQLFKFLSAFPSLKTILAHWGGGLPFYALMPEVKNLLAHTWVDCAATQFLYDDKVFRHVSELIGCDKLLFGSDYPLISQKQALATIKSLDLDESIKHIIVGGNAEKLINTLGK